MINTGAQNGYVKNSAIVAGIIVFAVGCAGSYNPAKKYAPAQLQQDLGVLRTTYERCHPSLYWHTPKPTIDSAFDAVATSLTDSLTEQQFKLRLAQAVALVHCGHTSIGGSKGAQKYRSPKPLPLFPLQAKIWNGDSMVVLANAHRTDSLLIRGAVITAINGRSVSHIIDTLCAFVSGDGIHRNFKYQVISSNFAGWYKSIFGLSPSYTIHYVDTLGRPAVAQIKNFEAKVKDSTAPKPNVVAQKPPPKQLPQSKRLDNRRLIIDTARGLAILQLNTFTAAGMGRFFKTSFKTIARMGLKHLAIELRENGGGSITNNIRLTKYISKLPFKIADTVAARSLAYPYPLRVKKGFQFGLQRLIVGRRRADGRIHYTAYERKQYQPKRRHHFDGQVYIINGGLTFSASILFQWPLIGQANITTLGEETGGGWYGNSAVNTPTLVLPNTKLRARLPLYRLVINQNEAYKGRGILPMVPVPPSSWHLRQRLDPKMVEVYRRVDQK